MGILKTIGLVVLYIIGIIVFATIMALGTLFTYFYLQMFLFGRGDYLLFVASGLNMIPVLMLMILIIYAFFQVKEKFLRRKENHTEIIEDNEEPINVETLGKFEKLILKLLNKLIALEDTIIKIFKVIKICYIPVLIIAVYCGMTSYAILYSDSIKVSTPIAPTGVVYKYDDIKSIDVGVEKEKRNSYSPYYKVTFNDNRSVNLFGGSMHEDKGKGFEYILIDLDKELESQGVSKRVNKVNFKEYSKALDKDFISRVEKLFDGR